MATMSYHTLARTPDLSGPLEIAANRISLLVLALVVVLVLLTLLLVLLLRRPE